jgi:hypothetical protein
MKDFVNERWRTILARNGLTDFDALWDLKADWFEAPNHRRGGWSGVSRCELDRPEGGKVAVFLKRQENHKARIWSHPVHGAPTFLREFRTSCITARVAWRPWNRCTSACTRRARITAPSSSRRN